MFNNFRLKDFSDTLKPRERLKNYGAAALSDAELLAIIVSSGGKGNSAFEVAVNLINRYETLKKVFTLDLQTLMQIFQIGEVKAITIKAIEEISKRIIDDETIRPIITSPKDIFKIVRKYTFAKQEEYLYVLSLDSKNRLISTDLLSRGSVNETIASPREVYKKAFQNDAVSIILVHNHPSNDVTPSNEDIAITHKIAAAGIKLGVVLLDHIVVTDTDFSSLKALNVFNTYNIAKGGE